MRVKKVDLTPLDPKCLNFIHKKTEHKSGAYTSDGWMLPCCWLDDPKNDYGVEYFGMKDDHLRVRNVDSLNDIYTSDEWDHFFDTLLNNPERAMKHCQYKCGNLKKDNNLYQKNVI